MKEADIAFYTTVAQLLPVLVIFAAIELRFLRPDTGAPAGFKRVRFWLVLIFCPMVLFAEQASLNALMNDHVSIVITKSVIFVIAMICLGIVLLAPAIYHLNEWEPPHGSKDDRD